MEVPATGEVFVVARQRAVDEVERRLGRCDAPYQVLAVSMKELPASGRFGSDEHLAEILQADAASLARRIRAMR